MARKDGDGITSDAVDTNHCRICMFVPNKRCNHPYAYTKCSYKNQRLAVAE